MMTTRMETGYETTDLALASFAVCSDLAVEPDFNDPYRVIFSIYPREKGEELAKNYFFRRQELKNQIFEHQKQRE